MKTYDITWSLRVVCDHVAKLHMTMWQSPIKVVGAVLTWRFCVLTAVVTAPDADAAAARRFVVAGEDEAPACGRLHARPQAAANPP